MELQHNVVGDIFQRVKDGKKTLQSDTVQKKEKDSYVRAGFNKTFSK